MCPTIFNPSYSLEKSSSSSLKVVVVVDIKGRFRRFERLFGKDRRARPGAPKGIYLYSLAILELVKAPNIEEEKRTFYIIYITFPLIYFYIRICLIKPKISFILIIIFLIAKISLPLI